MAARLLSRAAFHLPLSFLTRTSVHQKTPRNEFKNTLLSCSPDVVKLRSQFAALIAPTSEREDGRDRTRSEVTEWSRCTFYGRRLRFEFPGRWNTENSWRVCKGATDTGNKTTIAWREGSVLKKETRSKWKHGRQNSWDKGVEGKEEIGVSRNGRRLVPTEEKRNPFKSGVV